MVENCHWPRCMRPRAKLNWRKPSESLANGPRNHESSNDGGRALHRGAYTSDTEYGRLGRPLMGCLSCCGCARDGWTCSEFPLVRG